MTHDVCERQPSTLLPSIPHWQSYCQDIRRFLQEVRKRRENRLNNVGFGTELNGSVTSVVACSLVTHGSGVANMTLERPRG